MYIYYKKFLDIHVVNIWCFLKEKKKNKILRLVDSRTQPIGRASATPIHKRVYHHFTPNICIYLSVCVCEDIYFSLEKLS